METPKDLLTACRGVDGTIVDAPARTTPYTYDEFVSNVWKAGNLLRYYGVHPGSTVTVLAGRKHATATETDRRVDTADPLVAILGAMTIGATTRLQATGPVESRALVLPAGWIGRYETTPQCSVLAYGGPPNRPDVAHFETELWSENPTRPPECVDPTNVALADATGEYSHRTVFRTATEFASEYDLTSESRIQLDAPITASGVVVAVLSALASRATVVLDLDERQPDADVLLTRSDSTTTQDPRTVRVETVTERLRDTRRV